MRAILTIGGVSLSLLAGCSLSPYFESAPQCEEGESRERVLACGPCLTGTATDTCNERRQWVEVACDDPTSDADGDLFPNNECVTGEPVDCNDHDPLAFPGATGLEVCMVGETLPCTTSCGTPSVQPCTAACTWGPCIECTPDSSTDCTTTCGSTGRTMCTADCVPATDCTPPEEICNEIDDDCDTVVNGGDAGCVPGDPTSCTTTCGTVGIGNCTAVCAPALAPDCPPPVEACNGRDDDCDTQSDEEWDCWVGDSQRDETPDPDLVRYCLMDCTWSSWQESTELCNGRDDDGDDIADEGFPCRQGSGERCTDAGCTPLTCTTDCGSVGSGTCSDTCNPPSGGACVPPDEVCDGSDNDCNDGIDEDWRDVLGVNCDGDDTDLCIGGEWICNGGGVRCTDDAVSLVETCNALDDDCDGVANEGFDCQTIGASGTCTTTCGSGGSRICTSSCTWPTTCTAPGETCNGADDDCVDGADNGYPCVRNTSVSCTTTCGSIGSGTCAGCVIPTPTSCTPPAEICNGRDDDCNDGVDEAGGAVACHPGATNTACGSCPGNIATCSSGCVWGACIRPAEICNARDDDCDGGTDEASFGTVCGCFGLNYASHQYQVCPGTVMALMWPDADARCRSWGYQLATINGWEENNALLSMINTLGASGDAYWIGLNDSATEGSWAWSSGSSTYRNWDSATGQPDNGGAAADQDCVTMVRTRGGRWDDLACWDPPGFICEF